MCNRNDEWVAKQVKMLKDKFQEVTVESGDELGLVGIQISMDQKDKKVIVTQPKHVERIIETFQVTKGAPSPAMVKWMADDEDSPLL
ncbi:MAG: hypothetical protein ACK53Y_15540, partial [bacterium]